MDSQNNSQNFLNALLQLPCQMHWVDAAGIVRGCNENAAKFFGFTVASQMLGKNYHNLYCKEDANALSSTCASVISTGQSIQIQELVKLYNGKARYLQLFLSPLKEGDGEIIGVLIISSDLTEKNNELATLIQIISILPGHVWWTDQEAKILGCNHEMAKNFGFHEPKDLFGKSSYDLLPEHFPQDKKRSIAEKMDTLDKQVMATNQAYQSEEQFEQRNGQERIFYSKKSPIKDLDGHVIGTISIAQDITELKENHQKLGIANKAKSEFIANMSHDLRTPMTGMLGESEYIETHGHNEDIRERGRCLKEATQQLLRLSNDILEYVSLDSGYFDDPIIVFDPVEVIQNVITLMRVSLRHRSLDFKFEMDPKVPAAVKGYRSYFERIVSNLLANAIKFTEAGSVAVYLRVALQSSDEVTLNLIVEDTGVGIPADKYEEIFEQFSKLSSSDQGLYKGSGLGLYSVKQYVGQMQGRIEVDSIVGKGTKFIVNLPFLKAVAAKTVQIHHFRHHRAPIVSYSESCEITTLDATKNKPIKILVVEDSPLPARALLRLLNDYDCEVKLVENGEDAVKALIRKRYDLVIMDIGLPGIDGIETTRQIRRLPKNNDIPIVALTLTGHIREKKKPDCIDAGMQDMYAKPLMREQLKGIFETYIYHKENKAANDLQVRFDKTVLDIHSMMERFAMRNPLQLLDVFESAAQFIPDSVSKLNLAIKTDDLEAIHSIMLDLKGGLSYLVAPNCNDLLKAWDGVFHEKYGLKSAIYAMLGHIQDALSALQNAIEAVLTELKD